LYGRSCFLSKSSLFIWRKMSNMLDISRDIQFRSWSWSSLSTFFVDVVFWRIIYWGRVIDLFWRAHQIHPGICNGKRLPVSGSRGQQLHQALNETLVSLSARSWFEVIIFISSLQMIMHTQHFDVSQVFIFEWIINNWTGEQIPDSQNFQLRIGVPMLKTMEVLAPAVHTAMAANYFWNRLILVFVDGAVSGAHGAVGLGRRLRWSHCARAGDVYHKALGHESSSGTCDSWLALVRRIGFVTSLGWAQHIVDRWRDAVSSQVSQVSNSRNTRK